MNRSVENKSKQNGETFLKTINGYIESQPRQTKLFKCVKMMKIEKKVYELMEVISDSARPLKG